MSYEHIENLTLNTPYKIIEMKKTSTRYGTGVKCTILDFDGLPKTILIPQRYAKMQDLDIELISNSDQLFLFIESRTSRTWQLRLGTLLNPYDTVMKVFNEDIKPWVRLHELEVEKPYKIVNIKKCDDRVVCTITISEGNDQILYLPDQYKKLSDETIEMLSGIGYSLVNYGRNDFKIVETKLSKMVSQALTEFNEVK